MFGRKKEKNVFDSWDEYSNYLKASEEFNNFEGEKFADDGSETPQYASAKANFEAWTERKETWYDLHNKEIEANKTEKSWPKIVGAGIGAGGAIVAAIAGAYAKQGLEERDALDRDGGIADMQKTAVRNSFNGRH